MFETTPTRPLVHRILAATTAAVAASVTTATAAEQVIRAYETPPRDLLSLGSLVFNDANDNGVRDTGEAGHAGVVVRLYRSAGSGAERMMVTDQHGAYLFSSLEPGDYVVEVLLPDGTRSSTDVAGAATPENGTPDDDNGVGVASGSVRSAVVSLAFGQEPRGETRTSTYVNPASDANSDLTIDFGVHRPGVQVVPLVPPPPEPSATTVSTATAPTSAPETARTRLAVSAIAGSRTFRPGRQGSYRVTVRNTGRTTAKGVRVCAELPRFVSVAPGQSGLRVAGRTACRALGGLAPGELRTSTIRLSVGIAARGRLTAVASGEAANAAATRTRVSTAVRR